MKIHITQSVENSNLCESCEYEVHNCDAEYTGHGKGQWINNVIRCEKYAPGYGHKPIDVIEVRI